MMEYIILAFFAGVAVGFSGLALALHLINREQDSYWEPARTLKRIGSHEGRDR